MVTVVGAGRGPLITAALSAAREAGVQVRVYAVEKNENAAATLRSRLQREAAAAAATAPSNDAAMISDPSDVTANDGSASAIDIDIGSGSSSSSSSMHREVWHNRVIIIEEDMRRWTPPELCDVMVSELLGSFGDNELSPECLDGAQRCLQPGGVSVPQDYHSFLAPVSSAKLWCAAQNMEASTGFGLLMTGCSSGSGSSMGVRGPHARGSSLEVPYVVNLHSYTKLAQEQRCFGFHHPRPAGRVDNRR